MDNLITGTEAKAADRYAIDILKIPSLTLMERASRFVADAALRFLSNAAHGTGEHNAPGADANQGKDTAPASVVILCGVGNNGADGVCAGKMLLAEGIRPKVLISGNLEKASWEFLRQLSEYKAAGGVPVFLHAPEEFRAQVPEADLLIDAAFGIGLKRPLEGIWRELLKEADALDAYRIAVDVPSGINADTGEEMGARIRADETIPFGRNKTGLAGVPGTAGPRPAGAAAAGTVRVCDIGIPAEAYTYAAAACRQTEGGANGL